MSNKINLSEAAIDSLYRISKWTKFFSILGFIFTGISLLGALFYLASQIDAEQGNAYRLGYSFGILGLGTLYYFLSMHLYKFSKKIQESINSKDDLIFEDAMMHFSSYWLITGVVTEELMYDEQLPTRTNAEDNGGFTRPLSIDIDSSGNVYVLACIFPTHENRLELGMPLCIIKFNSSGTITAKKLIGHCGVSTSSYQWSGSDGDLRKWGAHVRCLSNGKLLVVSTTKGATNNMWPLDFMVLANDLTPAGDRKQFGPYHSYHGYSHNHLMPWYLTTNGNAFSLCFRFQANQWNNSWATNNLIVGTVSNSGGITFTRLYRGQNNNPLAAATCDSTGADKIYTCRMNNDYSPSGSYNLQYSMTIDRVDVGSDSWNNDNYWNDSNDYSKVLFWTTGNSTSNTGNSSSKKLLTGSGPTYATRMLLDTTDNMLYLMVQAQQNSFGSGSAPAVVKINASTGVLVWSRSVVASRYHRDATSGMNYADGYYNDMCQSDDYIFVFGDMRENTDDEGWNNGNSNATWKWWRSRNCIIKIPKDGSGATSQSNAGVNSTYEKDNWIYTNDSVPLQTHSTQSGWSHISPIGSANSSVSTQTDGNWENRVGTDHTNMFFGSFSPWDIDNISADTSTKSVNVIALT